jgi:hypothetical protein
VIAQVIHNSLSNVRVSGTALWAYMRLWSAVPGTGEAG